MDEQSKYIVNFLRDRDSYHVPAALYRLGRLESLVTDIYHPALPKIAQNTVFRSLADHQSDRLPSERVKNCWSATLLQAVDKLFVKGKYDLSYLADKALSQKTSDQWKSNRASLLLYSGYAEEAFNRASGSPSRKFLFLFHPHHKLVSEILLQDAERFPEFKSSFVKDSELTATWRHARADREIAQADAIIAASGFSIRSARHAGAHQKTAVVPYFTEVEPNLNPDGTRSQSDIKFLFVGQGVQRKGLHHLFLAWRKAGLTAATLTCVCSRMHESIAQATPPGVIIKRGLSKQELLAEFDSANVFVMPSLVEGFGLVYLEAQRRGAYVIGTNNTGLPDISSDNDICSSVEAGNVDQIAQSLEEMYIKARSGEISYSNIVQSSLQYHFDQYTDTFARALTYIEA